MKTVLTALAILLTGCASQGPVALPNASPADSAAVRAGAVYVGMSAELARKSLGAPSSVSATETHSRWHYDFHALCGSEKRSCTRSSTLYIEDGKVARLHNFPGYRTLP